MRELVQEVESQQKPPPRDGQVGRLVAFTLVELLVVIAVIAILASLLLPSLSRARVGADNAVCRNNLRQYAVALRLYVDDFKYYPPCYLNETNATSGHEIFWDQRLEAYTKTKWVAWGTPTYNLNGGSPMPRTIQMCPSFARLRSIAVGPEGGCYAYNNVGWPMRDRYDQGGLGGTLLPPPPGVSDLGTDPSLIRVPLDRVRLTRDAEVLKPCDMISFGDACLCDPGAPDFLGVSGWIDFNGGFLDQRVDLGNETLGGFGLQDTLRDLADVHQRHAARWNLVFCDGHSEHGRTRDFFDEKQVEEIRRWNRDNRGYYQQRLRLNPFRRRCGPHAQEVSFFLPSLKDQRTLPFFTARYGVLRGKEPRHSRAGRFRRPQRHERRPRIREKAFEFTSFQNILATGLRSRTYGKENRH